MDRGDIARFQVRISRDGEGFDTSDDIITIAVGAPAPDNSKSSVTEQSTTANFEALEDEPTQKEFFIHAGVLQKTSDFFRTKCKAVWSGNSGYISLPNHSPAVFTIYATWLYSSGAMFRCIDADRAPTVSNTSQWDGYCRANEREWLLLACCYVLGEELLDTTFKRTIMRALCQKLRDSAVPATIWEVAPAMVTILYEGTPEKSPARRFMCDLFKHLCIRKCGRQQIAACQGKVPQDFFYDLLMATTLSCTLVRLFETFEWKPDWHSYI